MIEARIAADPEHRVDRPTLWVRAAVNDACDACENQRACAHCARFERDIRRRALEAPAQHLARCFTDRDDFRVRRWIGARLSRVVRNSYRPSRCVDDHAPNRHFSCACSAIGLSERKRHPIFVHAVSDRMNEEARPCH